ncbi:2-polyprenyl-6-methoxyphenol hydroxylase [Sinosporangium album]|uniref:2-polyprenyl-6-methoxyphenol hydroxylase n=1 Tax=Sinosporangium album TaxID=504805 RepID=A0A1G7UHU8_9ACTN|nr:FAD-dependent monooxygenase [Sinosporangium album]SDG47083.1 2-polyprenyl-6-methoxyphenol hydroxylase [Sinosporangium album]
MRILVSGASVAGPVLAYWLRRYGFDVTVVERAGSLRKTAGHAVDLFRPAVRVVERMGLREKIEAKKTGTDIVTLVAPRTGRRVDVKVANLTAAVSDEHIEVMRDELSTIFYEATREHVEYVFGDSIASIVEVSDGVEVTFERGDPRRFDLVVGADGLHSTVRRLTFGPEERFTTFIGAYLGVFSLPNYLNLDGQVLTYVDVGRLAGIYGDRHLGDARAIFLFHGEQIDYDYRDIEQQKQILRSRIASLGGEVGRLLEHMADSPAFYFDSITQVRMESWSRGRVTLVGDAGYSPGPAVGGGTSLAIVGAYVLAGELAAAGGDHVKAFTSYEREMHAPVLASRTFARGTARTLVPDSAGRLWAMVQAARLANALPTGLIRSLSKLQRGGARLHDEIRLKDY